LCRQCRLIPDTRGDSPQQAGDLCARLDEAEDIVDQDHDVRMEIVAEILRDGHGAMPDAKTHGWRLIHLTEHQNGLVEDTGGAHFAIKLLRLAAAFTNPAEQAEALI